MNYSIWLIGLVLFSTSCKDQELNTEDYSCEILIDWNREVMEYAIEEDGLLSLKGVRTEAMMHSAVHNAINNIVPKYTLYRTDINPTKASPMAAAAQAAYQVVVDQYPGKEKKLKLKLTKWIDSIENSDEKKAGIQLGKLAAEKILKIREEDNWNSEASYEWHPMSPGVYAEFNEHSATPEGFVFGAGWAEAQPFLLESSDQFRSPPPPAIDSPTYTSAFLEVKAYGFANSKLRSPDQEHLAMWWKDFVENSHNRLARELVNKEDLNLWEGARLFALLNMAIYDAYVNVFENKFHYNHWRPYTAIRWADHDGNPDTEVDTEWTNLHNHTYAFPSYPSAHGTASSAAMQVLSMTLGQGDDYSFDMVTNEVDSAGPFSGTMKMDPSTRSFNSFSEAGLEASMSRLYLGIHFRYDSEEGHRLGKQIGDFAIANYLQLKN